MSAGGGNGAGRRAGGGTSVRGGNGGRRRARSPLGLEPFVVELDRFRGPLDLLLHLIRSQDIDIFDIPIARITAQFQRAIEVGIDDMELDRAGEFLELASTLVRIKAQLLLPRPGELEWEEDPRADLVRRLLEYEYFQEVAHILSGAEADRARHFEKGWVRPRPPPAVPRDELEVSLEDFLEAIHGVPEPRPEPTHLAPVRVVTVEEKIRVVLEKIRRLKRFAFRKLFSSWRERPHVVASLLACLELAKQQVLRIEQVERFGSIWLLPGSNADEDVAVAEEPGLLDRLLPGRRGDRSERGATGDAAPARPASTAPEDAAPEDAAAAPDDGGTGGPGGGRERDREGEREGDRTPGRDGEGGG